MLLTDHAIELSRKTTRCEQVLGKVLKRICELCPNFAAMNCKRYNKIDSRDMVITGIESQEDSSNWKYWITLSYPRKGYITIQFRILNHLTRVGTSHDIVSFPLDSPYSEEDLISRTDEALKTTGFVRQSLQCSVA